MKGAIEYHADIADEEGYQRGLRSALEAVNKASMEPLGHVPGSYSIAHGAGIEMAREAIERLIEQTKGRGDG